MRPNLVGWSLVIFFLVAGIAFWIVIPEVLIGQIWVAVALLLAILYFRMNRKTDVAEELKRTGVRGEAQILEMTQTGAYVNEQPRVKFRLGIRAVGIEPFEDERTETVPLIALGPLSSGDPLAVYLKPEDPGAYVIDWLGASGPAGSTNPPGSLEHHSALPDQLRKTPQYDCARHAECDGRERSCGVGQHRNAHQVRIASSHQ